MVAAKLGFSPRAVSGNRWLTQIASIGVFSGSNTLTQVKLFHIAVEIPAAYPRCKLKTSNRMGNGRVPTTRKLIQVKQSKGGARGLHFNLQNLPRFVGNFLDLSSSQRFPNGHRKSTTAITYWRCAQKLPSLSMSRGNSYFKLARIQISFLTTNNVDISSISFIKQSSPMFLFQLRMLRLQRPRLDRHLVGPGWLASPTRSPRWFLRVAEQPSAFLEESCFFLAAANLLAWLAVSFLFIAVWYRSFRASLVAGLHSFWKLLHTWYARP